MTFESRRIEIYRFPIDGGNFRATLVVYFDPETQEVIKFKLIQEV